MRVETISSPNSSRPQLGRSRIEPSRAEPKKRGRMRSCDQVSRLCSVPARAGVSHSRRVVANLAKCCESASEAPPSVEESNLIEQAARRQRRARRTRNRLRPRGRQKFNCVNRARAHDTVQSGQFFRPLFSRLSVLEVERGHRRQLVARASHREPFLISSKCTNETISASLSVARHVGVNRESRANQSKMEMEVMKETAGRSSTAGGANWPMDCICNLCSCG